MIDRSAHLTHSSAGEPEQNKLILDFEIDSGIQRRKTSKGFSLCNRSRKTVENVASLRIGPGKPVFYDRDSELIRNKPPAARIA